MRYVKALFVGLLSGVVFAAAWLFAAGWLPLYWAQFNADGFFVGTTRVTGASIELAALIGFMLGAALVMSRGRHRSGR